MGCSRHIASNLLIIVLSVGSLCVAPSSASAESDAAKLARGQEALSQGRYEDAAAVGRELSLASRDDVQSRLLLARVRLRTGDHVEALRLVRRAATAAYTHQDEIDALTLRGHVEAYTGQYRAALRTWEQVLEDHPNSPGIRRARLARGELLHKLGRGDEASALLDAFADEYNGGLLQDSAGLTMVGKAVWLMEYYEDANEVLQEATEKDPGNVEALLAWGSLFLEKYNTEDAAFAYRSALKVNPRLPEALLGMARVHMESNVRDLEAARRAVDQALAINPSLPEAAVVKATLSLDVEDYDGAIALLEAALKVNPNHFEALNLLAACHYLKDDARAFEKVRAQAFRLNPRWAAFYTSVARFGVRAHRYEEAIALNQKALEIDPKYWPAFVELGIGYTRIGDDARGFEFLLMAHRNDPFNVRAFNMVKLYEESLPEYHYVDRGPLRFRFHKAESSVLSGVVPDLAREALEALSRRYKMSLREQISVEVFRDAHTFSVRSVGVPNVSPHGICFGRVVTSRSPSESAFNWAEVIWHELAHSFHLELSRSRVPRWFTEGLAEYEAGRARPEWRRERDRQLVVKLREGRLWSLGDLNRGFTQAETIDDVVDAYFQSTLVLEFMVDRWGFDAVLKMLTLYGESKTTPEVLKATTGLDVRGFDAAFKAYLQKRYAVLLGSFDPHPSRYRDLEGALKAASARPKDANAQAELAMALYVARRVDESESAARNALAINPRQPLALYLNGVFALRVRQYARARQHLSALLKAGRDGYAVRLLYAELSHAEGKVDESIEHYKKAVEFYPQGLEAHRRLARIYVAQRDAVLAGLSLDAVTRIDQGDYEAALELMRHRRQMGDVGEAYVAGVRALHINPFHRELHEALGELALQGGRSADAIDAFELALRMASGQSSAEQAGLLIKLASARFSAGDVQGARHALQEAAAAQPEHPELEALRQKLLP